MLSSLKVVCNFFQNANPNTDRAPDLLNPNLDALEEPNDTSALDALTSRRPRKPEKGAQIVHSAADAVSSENASTSISEQPISMTDTPTPGAAELEEEAEGEGAFNPETGEINWDCPCLGGMAHGPCGPQFREAFSCFVFSKEEPKGMDCIEKFQGMRDCFHEHPDVYKDEIMDDEEIDRELEAENQELAQQIAARQKADNEPGRRLLEEPAPEPRPARKTKKAADEQPSPEKSSPQKPSSEKASKSSPSNETASPTPESPGNKGSHPAHPGALAADTETSGDDIVPKAAHDASAAKVSANKS